MNRSESILSRILSEVKMDEASFSLKDDILAGITFEDLIDTVQSNERVINEKTIKKVFNEIVKLNMEDANSVLRSKMKEIIKMASR